MSLSSQNISPAERYAYEFQNSEPKYFTMVPNIIDHLTYTTKNIDGSLTKNRLSVYAKELYRIIRMIANDGGVCFNTTKNLALKMNCSVGSICKAKKELLQPIDQLDGNALLFEKKKSSPKIVDGKVQSRRDLCVYTVTDIWKWNNAFMSTLKFHNQQFGRNTTDAIPEVDKSKYTSMEDYYEKTDSQCESVGGTDSQYESVSPVTDSPGEPNNITANKNPLFKEQQFPPTGDSAISLKKEGGLFLSADKEKIYEWLIQEGCNPSNAKSIATKFPRQDVSDASRYLINCIAKKKAKGEVLDNESKWKYFTKILNERYWEKK